MGLLKAAFWAGVGAAAGYLFDPVAGNGRRARLKDQTVARVRDAVEEGGDFVEYQRGRLRGVAHELTSSDADEPARTDAELLQKVRSEAIGPMQAPLEGVDLRVEDGVVYLKGRSTDEDVEQELVERIQAVAGTREVRNELSVS